MCRPIGLAHQDLSMGLLCSMCRIQGRCVFLKGSGNSNDCQQRCPVTRNWALAPPGGLRLARPLPMAAPDALYPFLPVCARRRPGPPPPPPPLSPIGPRLQAGDGRIIPWRRHRLRRKEDGALDGLDDLATDLRVTVRRWRGGLACRASVQLYAHRSWSCTIGAATITRHVTF